MATFLSTKPGSLKKCSHKKVTQTKQTSGTQIFQSCGSGLLVWQPLAASERHSIPLGICEPIDGASGLPRAHYDKQKLKRTSKTCQP
jgi:hypothetical protein